MVTLECNGDILVLTNPLLGDKVDSINSIDYKRSMSGDVITYVNKNSLKRYNWQIVMSRIKYYEFRSFFNLYHNERWKVTDHKGQIIQGVMLNNPLTFTEERRGDFSSPLLDEEIVTVDLVFEGVVTA